MMQIHVNLPLALCCNAIGLALQLIEGAQVRFGGGHHNIWVCARSVDHAATVLQAYRHLTLAFGGAAYGID